MVKRVMKIILMVLGGVAVGVVVAFLLGWVVMLLWNWLMPSIFGLPAIGFLQAWGLVLLAHILFKAGRHGPGHDGFCHPHSYWRDKFREKMEEHCCAKPSRRSAAKKANAR